MRQKIGFGVLSWDGAERRSNRYGSVHLDDMPYEGQDVGAKATLDASVENFIGQRVRLTVKVLESRKSGHIGDLFLSIRPSQPDVGEEVDLGIGVLQLAPSYSALPAVELRPLDGRAELWIDPRKLYRVHDQTVELYAEHTTDEPTSVMVNTIQADEAVGDGEGGIQVKCRQEGSYKIPPKFEPLGGGMFKLTQVGATVGERFKMEKT